MYAINHAATALLLKKNQPAAPILPLLISVQLMEVFWVLFNYLGLEHYTIAGGRVHLDFLPYSHSVFSGLLAAIISFIIIDRGYHQRKMAIAFAIGVMSHIVVDIIFHEKDIRLSPFAATPAWGLGIIDFPFVNFGLEFAYGLFCWWYFRGSRALLIAIVVFNFIDLPMMLAHGDMLLPFQQYPFLLPTVILIQILVTWYFVWHYSKERVTATV